MSPMGVYDLNIELIPSNVVMANSGCFLPKVVSIKPAHSAIPASAQKRRGKKKKLTVTVGTVRQHKLPNAAEEHKKNSRKESNISMKKDHHRPTLGVKSGSNRWTPYVDARNSHEPPVMPYDSPPSLATVAANTAASPAAKLPNEQGFRSTGSESYASKTIGGSSSRGYSDR